MIRIVIALLILPAGYCAAQPKPQNMTPMKYALIDGGTYPMSNRSNTDLYYRRDDYYEYAAAIVRSYQLTFKLSKTQELILMSGLMSYHSITGIQTNEIHLYIADRMQAILTEAQYQHWKGLSSYPEYKLFNAEFFKGIIRRN